MRSAGDFAGAPRYHGAAQSGRRTSRGGAHGRSTCAGRAARGLPCHHAEPAAPTQRVQRGDASGAQTRARRGRGGCRLPRAIADRRRPCLLRRPGFARADDPGRQDDRARGRARHPLQPACAQAAHIAVSSRCRGQRRRGRRRRQHCARLRHRAGGALGDLRASSRSASSPIAGARGCCRGWSVPPAPAGLR